MKFFLGLMMAGFFLLACGNEEGAPTKKMSSEPDTEKKDDLSVFLESLQDVQSIEFRDVLSPKDPYADKVQLLTNKDTVSQIKSWINNRNVVSFDCDNYDGKLYLLKDSSLLKTVYYSFADSCSFLGYNINGKNYYVPMSEGMEEYFKNIERKFAQ